MPRVKQFDRDEILSKATSLFWKNGYHATSIQDLVTHLGINRASIYDTYGGKKQLFEEAFDLYRKKGANDVSDFLKKHSDVKVGFQKLFERAIEEAVMDEDRKGCLVVNSATELIPGDLVLQKKLEEHKLVFEQTFYSYLKEGVKKESISKDKDIKTLAEFLFTWYNGIRVISKMTPNSKTLLDSIKTGLEVLG